MNTKADSPLPRPVNDEVVLEVDEVVTEVTEGSDLPEEPPVVVEVETPNDKLLSPLTMTRLSPLWEHKRILYHKDAPHIFSTVTHDQTQ